MERNTKIPISDVFACGGTYSKPKLEPLKLGAGAHREAYRQLPQPSVFSIKGRLGDYLHYKLVTKFEKESKLRYSRFRIGGWDLMGSCGPY